MAVALALAHPLWGLPADREGRGIPAAGLLPVAGAVLHVGDGNGHVLSVSSVEIVHYYLPNGRVRPAIVLYAYDEETVDLSVLTSGAPSWPALDNPAPRSITPC